MALPHNTISQHDLCRTLPTKYDDSDPSDSTYGSIQIQPPDSRRPAEPEVILMTDDRRLSKTIRSFSKRSGPGTINSSDNDQSWVRMVISPEITVAPSVRVVPPMSNISRSTSPDQPAIPYSEYGYASLKVCEDCHEVYKNNSLRKKHILQHLKLFKCLFPTCANSHRGFATLNDLDRHEKSVHMAGIQQWWKCAYPHCFEDRNHYFTRKDNFIAHIKRRHGQLREDQREALLMSSQHHPTTSEVHAEDYVQRATKLPWRSPIRVPTSRTLKSPASSDSPTSIHKFKYSKSTSRTPSSTESAHSVMASTETLRPNNFSDKAPRQMSQSSDHHDRSSYHSTESAMSSPLMRSPTLSNDSTISNLNSASDDYVDPFVLDYVRDNIIREVENIGISQFFRMFHGNDDLSHHFVPRYVEEAYDGNDTRNIRTAAPRLSMSSSSKSDSKRPRDTAGDNPNESGKKIRRVTVKPGSGISGRRLACFYHQYDPLTYRNNFSTGSLFEYCATRDYENMNRLFEHLDRKHCESLNQCPICGVCFPRRRDDYNTHMRRRSCPRQEYVDILTTSRSEIESIKSELRNMDTNRTYDEEAKWRFVYTRLFLRTNGNPYLGSENITTVSMMEDFFARNLTQRLQHQAPTPELLGLLVPQLFQEFRRQYNLESPLPVVAVGSPVSAPVIGPLFTTPDTTSTTRDSSTDMFGQIRVETTDSTLPPDFSGGLADLQLANGGFRQLSHDSLAPEPHQRSVIMEPDWTTIHMEQFDMARTFGDLGSDLPTVDDDFSDSS